MHREHSTHSGTLAPSLLEFAQRLVRELGLEDAVGVCRANHWDGILWVIHSPMVVAEAGERARD